MAPAFPIGEAEQVEACSECGQLECFVAGTFEAAAVDGLTFEVDQLELDGAVVGCVVLELEAAVATGIGIVEVGGFRSGEGYGGSCIDQGGAGKAAGGSGHHGTCRGDGVGGGAFGESVFDVLSGRIFFLEFDVDVIGAVGYERALVVFKVPSEGNAFDGTARVGIIVGRERGSCQTVGGF